MADSELRVCIAITLMSHILVFALDNQFK